MNLTCLKSGIWQAELRVPQEVRPVIGKTRFDKSTGTRDKREAVLRAAGNSPVKIKEPRLAPLVFGQARGWAQVIDRL